MTQNRFYSSGALATTITASMTSSGNPSVSSITGLPSSYPYTMLIDWGLVTQEAISVTSTPTGGGPWVLPCTRGIDGTTAQSHSNGASIVHGVTAEDYNEPQVHISLATSGTGINAVHGLANGSAVVGTTDTQTLTNKTLTAPVITGDIALSASDPTNSILQVTNTSGSVASPIILTYAALTGIASVAVRVTGDTKSRFHILSDGKLAWGTGAANTDTSLFRSGVNALTTNGSLTISEGAAAGAVLVVANTTTTPSAPTIQFNAQTAADALIGIGISADTVDRLTVDSNGKHAWGAGGASATDTDLYRNAAGELKTDNSLTVAGSAQVGGTRTLAGGVGVLGITTAGTPPSGTVSGGGVLYGSSGLLKYLNSAGMATFVPGTLAATVTPVVVANTVTATVIGTGTIAANDPVAGAVYELYIWGNYSTTGTPTVAIIPVWGTGGTAIHTSGIVPTAGSSVTNANFRLFCTVTFITSTTLQASTDLRWTTVADGTTSTATTYFRSNSSAVTVTTSSAQALNATWTWGTASASNTVTAWGSSLRRVS